MPDDVKPRSDKQGLPSRHTTVGPERAPHRSYLYAMGLTEEEIYLPLVGVATTWNEANSGMNPATVYGFGTFPLPSEAFEGGRRP